MKPNSIILPPDEAVMVTDTAEAQLYAKHFEMLNPLLLASGLPQTALFVYSQNHPTHWLLAGLYKGFAKPEDNGMNFFGFPKSRQSLDDVRHFFTPMLVIIILKLKTVVSRKILNKYSQPAGGPYPVQRPF